MDFSEITNTVDTMQSQMVKLEKEFREKMQNLFNEASKSFFVEAPMIKAIVWNQYTPYFNDGEECVFGVNDVYFITGNDHFDINNYDLSSLSWGDFDGEELEEDDEADFFVTSTWKDQHLATIEKYGQEAFNAVIAMNKIIYSNSDIMKAVFGDHSMIAILPDRTIVEEFDHD